MIWYPHNSSHYSCTVRTHINNTYLVERKTKVKGTHIHVALWSLSIWTAFHWIDAHFFLGVCDWSWTELQWIFCKITHITSIFTWHAESCLRLAHKSTDEFHKLITNRIFSTFANCRKQFEKLWAALKSWCGVHCPRYLTNQCVRAKFIIKSFCPPSALRSCLESGKEKFEIPVVRWMLWCLLIKIGLRSILRAASK